MKFALHCISVEAKPFIHSYAPVTLHEAMGVGSELMRDGVACVVSVKATPDFVLTRDEQYFSGKTVGAYMDAAFVLCRRHLKEHHASGSTLRSVRAIRRGLLGCDSCHNDGPFIP